MTASIEIKAIRQAAGFTQRQLADLLGVKVLAIKRWEAGTRSPNEECLSRLRALTAPPPAPAPPSPPPAAANRVVLRLAQAVRLMGLRDDGHGRRSDRTLRNALQTGQLPGWKAPGYRAAIAEWCFYADDFEHWRAAHYHAERDPRRGQAETDWIPSLDTSTKEDYQAGSHGAVEMSGKIRKTTRPAIALKPADRAPRLVKKR